MTESYTTGGDKLFRIEDPDCQAQTFVPREDHTLEFIDLNLRFSYTVSEPTPRVYWWYDIANPLFHERSAAIYITENHSSPYRTGRVRFKMSSTLLEKGEHYTIALSRAKHLPPEAAWWEYDEFAAQYPYGIRLTSNNAGLTWTRHDNSDCIFAEFGTPPLPKPEPPPPISNFAVMDIAYTHWDKGLTIRIPTNVPCHLTCYYTENKPLKHDLSRMVRGILVPWSTYFCFTAWKSVDQTELGDTLWHTFEFPDWTPCQTKWFTFRGDIDLVNVPSVGPIFEHHHPGGLLRAIALRPDGEGFYAYISNTTPLGQPHWQMVKEEIPDEDATCVWEGLPYPHIAQDHYHLQSPPPNIGKIDRLDVFIRTRAQFVTSTSIRFKSILDVGTATFFGTPYTGQHFYQTVPTAYLKNPVTNKPWLVADLATLQAGVELECDYTSYGFCTQVYIVITRGIEGGPD